MKYRHDPTDSAPSERSRCHGKVSVEAPFGSGELESEGTQTVTFSPGSKTRWHTHPLEQTIIVRSGEGLLNIDGEGLDTIHAGDILRVPANTRHWLGATGSHALVCMLVTHAVRGHSVTWEEPAIA